jgi:hypothetical protein
MGYKQSTHEILPVLNLSEALANSLAFSYMSFSKINSK